MLGQSELTKQHSAARPQRVDGQQDTAVWEGLRALAELPAWVLVATDPEQVGRAVTRHIPEFSSGQLDLVQCAIHHVRFKDGGWTETCELAVQHKTSGAGMETVTLLGTLLPPEQARQRQVQVEGDFGKPGWHACLPDVGVELGMHEPEKVLAALTLLTDPERSRELLETSIRAGAPGYEDFRIQTCIPRVARYKPGSRCTIVYHLQYSPEHDGDGRWPELVVAKTYRGEKGLNAYQGMRELWDSPLGTSPDVTIAEPLAYLPEIKVLVQGPIREEQTLKEMVRAAIREATPAAMDEVFGFMRKTAAGVIALHRSAVKFGPTWRWEDELADVREVLDDLAQAMPELAAAARPLLERLESLAAAYPPDPPVPAHGSFRPAQVLINQGRIGFIDFDSFCQAEPALDLALFMGNVKSIGLTIAEDDEDAQALDPDEQQSRLVQLRAACQAFLEAYEASLPVTHERIALWETLDLLTIILHSWTKVKPVRLKNTMFLLEQHLRTSGLVGLPGPSDAA